MRKPKLSIVIPAYNEEQRIKETLEQLIGYFKRQKILYEILVMMDGCTDNTAKIVKSFKRKHIKGFSEPIRLGKGMALLKGISLSKGEYVAYVDADGSTPPDQLLKLMEELPRSNYSAVIGSRWMKGSVMLKKQPLRRRIASRGFNLLVRNILGLPYKDTQCPAKVFRGDVIRSIATYLDVSDYCIDIAILNEMKKRDCIVEEIPIVWQDRPLSKVKVRKMAPRAFITILKMWWNS